MIEAYILKNNDFIPACRLGDGRIRRSRDIAKRCAFSPRINDVITVPCYFIFGKEPL